MCFISEDMTKNGEIDFYRTCHDHFQDLSIYPICSKLIRDNYERTTMAITVREKINAQMFA